MQVARHIAYIFSSDTQETQPSHFNETCSPNFTENVTVDLKRVTVCSQNKDTKCQCQVLNSGLFPTPVCPAPRVQNI